MRPLIQQHLGKNANGMMTMQAVIKTGGKQYRVSAGDKIRVETLRAEVGAAVEFDQVLMLADGDNSVIGSPTVANGKVTAKVVEHGRADKVHIVKFKRRKGYLRRQGHRQNYTEVEITDIAGAKVAKAKAGPKAAAKAKAQTKAAPEAKAPQAKTPQAKAPEAKTAAKTPAKPAGKAKTETPAKPATKKATVKTATKPAAKAPAKPATKPKTPAKPAATAKAATQPKTTAKVAGKAEVDPKEK